MSKGPESRGLALKRRFVFAYLLGALVLSVGITCVRSRAGMTAVYQKAAERFVQGEQFYRPDDPAAFTYPPFFVLPYLPLSALPETAARTAWYFANFCLLAAVVWLTLRMIDPVIQQGARQGKARARTAYLLIAVFAGRFLISPVEYQSHDLLVYALLMLAISAWAAEANGRAGGWTGIAAACKATPLLFLPVFLAQGRTRAVLLLVLALVLATFLPDLMVANPDRQPWVISWYQKFVSKVDAASAPDAKGAWVSWNLLNQSLSGTMYRLFTPIAEKTPLRWNVCLYPLGSRSLQAITLALKLAILGLLVWIAWPGRLRGQSPCERTFCTLGQGAAVLCAMLLLSPMSGKQHFCLLFAPLSFCLVDFLYRRRDPFVGLTLAMLFLFGALAGKDVVGGPLHRQLAAYGSLTWCTLACLLVCGYIVIGRSRCDQHIPHGQAEPSPADPPTTGPPIP